MQNNSNWKIFTDQNCNSQSKLIIEYLQLHSTVPIVQITADMKILSFNTAFKKLIEEIEELENPIGYPIQDIIEITTNPSLIKMENDHLISQFSALYKSSSGLNSFYQGTSIKSEDTNILILEKLVINEESIISELSNLNLEMSNATRQLVKKNRQLQIANEKIEHLLNTDFLTSLYNRRYFFSQLEKILNQSNRKNDPHYGLIAIDIDKFKNINDSYGHDVGDLVLTEFSHMLKQNTRNIDISARIGGEEFASLINCSKNDLLQIAENLRQKTSELTFPDLNISITASFGLAFIREKDDISSFIKRADNNLYKAKNTGRNKVVFE